MSRAPALTAAALGAIYLACVGRHAWLAEDAFITFRYAANLVGGHGLRYNASDPEPLEGYSNFLWLLVSALFEGFGWSPAVGVCAVSVACGLATLAVVAHTAVRHLALGRVASGGVVLILATFAPFVVWSTSGLEVMPQTLCFVAAAALLAFDDRPWAPWAGAAAALALALLRVEGIAWAPVVVGLALGLRHLEGRPLRPVVVAGLATGAAWSLYFAARTLYFGAWLPNTVFAKVGTPDAVLVDRGWKYVAASVLYLVLPAALALAPLAWRGRVAGPRWAFVLLLASSHPLWSVVVGGDYMPYSRFLVPSAPFLALWIGWLLERLAARWPAWSVGALAAALAAVGYLPTEEVLLVPQGALRGLSWTHEGAPFEQGRFVGRFARASEDRRHRSFDTEWRILGSLVRPGESVVLYAVGRNGYYNPEIDIVDACGLVSRFSALDRRAAGRRHGGPGHDHCLPRHLFARLQPTLRALEAYVVPHDHLQPVVRRIAVRMWRMDRDRHYYPTFALAPDGAGTLVAVGFRRGTDAADVRVGWERFRRDLEALPTGTPGRVRHAARRPGHRPEPRRLALSASGPGCCRTGPRAAGPGR